MAKKSFLSYEVCFGFLIKTILVLFAIIVVVQFNKFIDLNNPQSDVAIKKQYQKAKAEYPLAVVNKDTGSIFELNTEDEVLVLKFANGFCTAKGLSTEIGRLKNIGNDWLNSQSNYRKRPVFGQTENPTTITEPDGSQHLVYYLEKASS